MNAVRVYIHIYKLPYSRLNGLFRVYATEIKVEAYFHLTVTLYYIIVAGNKAPQQNHAPSTGFSLLVITTCLRSFDESVSTSFHVQFTVNNIEQLMK